MSLGGMRFMWLFVFFDLPVVTRTQRRRAAQFRGLLKDDGYLMIQYSVYARVCNGQESVEKHLRRISAELPEKGHIRAMQVTDQQYQRMKILLGKKTQNEQKNQPTQLLLF